MTETILQPDKISESRINFLIQKGIDCDIAAVNLEMIKFKIQNNDISHIQSIQLFQTR